MLSLISLLKQPRVGSMQQDFQLQTTETNFSWLRKEQILRAFWNPWGPWKTCFHCSFPLSYIINLTAATPATAEAAFTARESSSWTVFLVSATDSELRCMPATGRIWGSYLSFPSKDGARVSMWHYQVSLEGQWLSQVFLCEEFSKFRNEFLVMGG